MSDNKKAHNQNSDCLEGVAKGLASSSFSVAAALLFYAESLADLPEATGDIAVPVLAVAGLALTCIFAKEARGTRQLRPLKYAAIAGHIGAVGITAFGVAERQEKPDADTIKEITIEQTPVEAAAKADARTFVWQP